MEPTDCFLTLLQNFAPVFTGPTCHTFVVIVTGRILSQRHGLSPADLRSAERRLFGEPYLCESWFRRRCRAWSSLVFGCASPRFENQAFKKFH
jgi:hypothetical protein